MQSYYELNVAKDGKHLFATAERSAVNFSKAEELVRLFRKKFPNSEGYEISVTYWKCEGHQIKNIQN